MARVYTESSNVDACTWREVDYSKRKYHFPAPSSDLTLYNVVGMRISESGTHYLKMSNGEIATVAPKWDYVISEKENKC